MGARLWSLRVAICFAAVLIAGCGGISTAIAGTRGSNTDSTARGKATIEIYQCGKCHTIPGIPGANGVVGPPLESVADRTYIGGNFPNNPETLTHWIMAPQTMKPKTAMPSLGLSESQSRDVVAYLETLK
jgi:cytochrome c